MRNRIIVLFCALVVLLLPAITPAQDVPVTQTWSVNVQGVALPGGKTTLSGVDAGLAFTPSPNLDLFERNVLSSDRTLVFNGGGLRYRFPAFSFAANNASQNVNFLRVQFSLAGTFGMAQVNGGNHYGYLVGPRVDYQLTKGGAWTMGGSVEYAHFPGYPVKAVIELGSAFHF
jgi:hypothetical protein